MSTVLRRLQDKRAETDRRIADAPDVLVAMQLRAKRDELDRAIREIECELIADGEH